MDSTTVHLEIQKRLSLCFLQESPRVAFPEIAALNVH